MTKTEKSEKRLFVERQTAASELVVTGEWVPGSTSCPCSLLPVPTPTAQGQSCPPADLGPQLGSERPRAAMRAVQAARVLPDRTAR